MTNSKFSLSNIAEPKAVPGDVEHAPWSNLDFLILNRQAGIQVTGPGLIVHLIREHHFFEGVESPYRVDPVRVSEVLQLSRQKTDRRRW